MWHRISEFLHFLYLMRLRPLRWEIPYAIKLAVVKARLRPDYSSRYICINSRRGLIWVMCVGRARTFSKNELCEYRYVHGRSMGHGGNAHNFYGIHFLFKDGDSSLYAGFGSADEALVWKDRIDNATSARRGAA
jgi:hypothetical protein